MPTPVGLLANDLLHRPLVTMWHATLFGRDSGNRRQRRRIGCRRNRLGLVKRRTWWMQLGEPGQAVAPAREQQEEPRGDGAAGGGGS